LLKRNIVTIVYAIVCRGVIFGETAFEKPGLKRCAAKAGNHGRLNLEEIKEQGIFGSLVSSGHEQIVFCRDNATSDILLSAI
jgi:hypothetical protein